MNLSKILAKNGVFSKEKNTWLEDTACVVAIVLFIGVLIVFAMTG